MKRPIVFVTPSGKRFDIPADRSEGTIEILRALTCGDPVVEESVRSSVHALHSIADCRGNADVLDSAILSDIATRKPAVLAEAVARMARSPRRTA